MTGGWRLLLRHGWSWQSPARRAPERDEHTVELWNTDVWPQVKGPRRRSMHGILFEDEGGFAMTPPRAERGAGADRVPW
ncbi:winged helix-turn-helix domain-containing protein [Streptomyces griseorubiginosus]|uniref:winged helix-turn-helix domain-containing protein n=1 Tax=Streptomyces griseorubiginosus TaxID=67304 RepID=UPI003402507E